MRLQRPIFATVSILLLASLNAAAPGIPAALAADHAPGSEPSNVPAAAALRTTLPVTVAYDPDSIQTITTASSDRKYMPLLRDGMTYRLVIGAVQDSGGEAFSGYTLTFVA